MMKQTTKEKKLKKKSTGSAGPEQKDTAAVSSGAAEAAGTSETPEKAEASGNKGEQLPDGTGGAGDAGKGRVIDRKVLEKRRKQRILRRRIAAVVIVILIIVAALIVLWKLGVFKKKDPDKVLTPTVTRIEYTPRGEYIVSAVDGVVVICDENGATGIDAEGKWKWNSTLSASEPVFSPAGDLLLVTDKGGRSIWAFDGSGLKWRHITDTAIISAFLSGPLAGGGSRSSKAEPDLITVCEQEDFESAVILLSQNKGTLTEKFTRRFGKYHMLAAAEAPDRSQLAATGVYYEGGTLTGCTVFMRTSDGEVYSTLLSDSEVYLQLRYLNDGTVFASNSDSLKLIRKLPSVSGSGDTEKVLWSRNGGRKLIVDTAVTGGNTCIAAFRDDNVSGSGGMSELKYFDRAGNVTKTVEIRGGIGDLEVYGGNVAVFTEDAVYLINAGGNIIGTCDFESRPLNVAFMDAKTLAVNTASGIDIVSFE